MKKSFFCFIMVVAISQSARCAQDSLRIMSYNVLYYGNGCQGPNSDYHRYLSTIVRYANPDVLALVKIASIPVDREDKSASAPFGFADSILKFAMNPAYPGRYFYAPFTNKARSTNMVLLIYDSTKLGCLGLVSSYSNLIDFNTYKLYYKNRNGLSDKDTAFMYFTLNHDKSGDEMVQVRSEQITGEVRELKKHFSQLPNLIDLGDFNLRGSEEPLYQLLTNPADTNFRFSDPPFSPDHSLSYPANWDHDARFAKYFTTSTREFDGIPNSCGSAGGAKGWYDHIFLSDWIVRGIDGLRYIPNSYHTIGNDGNRFRVGVNNKNVHKNESVPPNVVDALFRMSNKYPVMLTVEVNTSNSGKHPVSTEIAEVPVFAKEMPVLNSDTVKKKIQITFPPLMRYQELNVNVVDTSGNSVFKKDFVVTDDLMELKCNFKPGTYKVIVGSEHSVITEFRIVKVRPD